jgi:hypothetical protein
MSSFIDRPVKKLRMTFVGARNEIPKINTLISDKCEGKLGYTLMLDDFKFKSKEAAVYDDTGDIILCLNNSKGVCVSSVVGKYNTMSKSMELLSRTDSKYEGKKLNLFLRTAFIWLMYYSRPEVSIIYSHSVNPISTYAMYKHFGATNNDLTQFIAENKIVDFTLQNAKDFHDYYKLKYRPTRESALDEIELMKEFARAETPYVNLEDLGIGDTTEEAIEYIKSNMDVHAITLGIEMSNADEITQTRLLEKLRSIAIICDTLPGGAKIKNTRKTKKAKKSKKSKSRKSGR